MGPQPIEFSLFNASFNDANNRVICDGGLQATITTPDYDFTVASPVVASGEGWSQEFGRFDPNEHVAVVIEAYCYREGQEPGYIKAAGYEQIGAPTLMSVFPAYVNEAEQAISCATEPDIVLEAVKPFPCVSPLRASIP